MKSASSQQSSSNTPENTNNPYECLAGEAQDPNEDLEVQNTPTPMEEVWQTILTRRPGQKGAVKSVPQTEKGKTVVTSSSG